MNFIQVIASLGKNVNKFPFYSSLAITETTASLTRRARGIFQQKNIRVSKNYAEAGFHNSKYYTMKSKRNNSGFGLLEIIVGISVISISLFGLASVSEFSLKVMDEASNNTKASFLLDEGVEAVKSLRDSSWSLNIAPLAVSNNYYLSFYNSKWQATSSNNYIDGIFERKFVLESVNRNINDDISSSGAIDTDTKRLTVYVSWKTRTGTTTKQITGYLTNLFNN